MIIIKLQMNIPNTYKLEIKQDHFLLKTTRRVEKNQSLLPIVCKHSQKYKIQFHSNPHHLKKKDVWKNFAKKSLIIRIQKQDIQLGQNHVLGYFLFLQYHPIYSMEDLDPVDGNILKIGNYFLLIQNNIIPSEFKHSNTLLFYRTYGKQIKFFKGYENFTHNIEIFFNVSNSIISQSQIFKGFKFTFTVKQGNIVIIWQKQYWQMKNNMILSLNPTKFQCLNYDHLIHKLNFPFFGLNDKLLTIFKLNQNQLNYGSGSDIQIKSDQFNQVHFYINNAQIYFSLQGTQMVQSQTKKELLYLTVQQADLFSIRRGHLYLSFSNNRWQFQPNIFLFQNKSHGNYIFLNQNSYQCLSSYTQNIIQDRYIDPEYAIYYSFEKKRFYLNERQIFITQYFKLSYQGIPFKLYQDSDLQQFYIGFDYNPEITYFLVYIQSNGRYRFTISAAQAERFRVVSVTDVTVIIQNYSKIQIKKISLSKFYLQNLQQPQNMAAKWLHIENQFAIYDNIRTVIGINPRIAFSDPLNFVSPFSWSNSYNLRVKIQENSTINFYKCSLRLSTFNYYDQISDQYFIGLNQFNIPTISPTKYIFYCHKIPDFVEIPPVLMVKDIFIQKDINLNQGYFMFSTIPRVYTFVKIGKNLYKPSQNDFIAVGGSQGTKLKQFGNTYLKNTTFSITQYSDGKFKLIAKFWKAINCQAYLKSNNYYSPIILSKYGQIYSQFAFIPNQ